MKSDKKKTKEPFSPEQTPQPPQVIEPGSEKERNEKKTPLDSGKEKAPPKKR